MRSRLLSRSLVLSLAGAPLLLGSLVEAADTNVGEAFSPNATCGGGYTWLQTGSGGPSYTLPSDGVITSVRIPGATGAASTRAFKLARGSGTSWTIVGSTDAVQVAAGQTLVQNVRIPGRQNDVLGVYEDGTGANNCRKLDGAGTYVFASGNIPQGTTFIASTASGDRTTVSATLEPDADNDGYGDSTQDKCASQASTQDLCRFSFGTVGKPTGKAKKGKTLTAPAITTPSGTTKTYQWYRVFKKRINGKKRTVTRSIAGATAATYTARRKDKGKKVFVQITASAPSYQTTAVNSGKRKVR